MGPETRTVPRIYAVTEDHQADHQSTTIEVDGNIADQSISVFVFIDLGSTHNYITPRLVEMCTLKKSKHRKSWLVQLATGT